MTQMTRTSRRNVWLGLALVLALGLTGFRAADALSPTHVTAPLEGASPIEARLTGLLETVIGAGHVQVHRAERPDGSQAFLVLINSAGGAADPGNDVVLRLLSSAVFIDTLAGDTVAFDRVAFVQGARGLPSRADLLEILALVSVCALTGAGMAASSIAPHQTTSRTGHSVHRQEDMPKGTTIPQGHQSLIAQRISEDPVRAAEVIRRWLGARAIDT